MSKAISGPNSPVPMIANVILAIISLLFVSNVHTSWKYKHTDEVLSDGLRIRLLAAQRDMYISGFSLFLFILLRMVYSGVEANIRLEKSLQAMQKQAQGAADGYKGLLEENEKMEKKLATLTDLSGDKKDVLQELLDQNSELKVKCEKLEEVAKQATSKVEVVKKQASSQGDAYMQLMEDRSNLEKKLNDQLSENAENSSQAQVLAKLRQENQSLKDQLKDYDFMFGDKKKKDE